MLWNPLGVLFQRKSYDRFSALWFYTTTKVHFVLVLWFSPEFLDSINCVCCRCCDYMSGGYNGLLRDIKFVDKLLHFILLVWSEDVAFSNRFLNTFIVTVYKYITYKWANSALSAHTINIFNHTYFGIALYHDPPYF